MRDDRVLPATRLLGAVIVPFLVVAFALLYFFPDDTRHWFAWDVQPTITPLIMGAGYIAGAYFFVRVARETRWHRVHVGFLPVAAFTLFMAIGTFNHLDRFATAHVAFWIWVGLYVATPVLVPWAWWRNRATDPGTPEPGEPPLPGFVRPLLVAAGAAQSAVALVLLLMPSTMIEHWPWQLTPLTAQTLGGWFALPGVTALMMGFDGRWTAIRITLESQLLGLALILLATIRAWEDVDTSNWLAYVFVAGIAGLFVSLLALEWYMLASGRARLRRARGSKPVIASARHDAQPFGAGVPNMSRDVLPGSNLERSCGPSARGGLLCPMRPRGFRCRSGSPGEITQPRSRGDAVAWFAVGLARQKRHYSLYVTAVEDGQPLGRAYGDRLGKVKVGSASVGFARLDDVDLAALREPVEHADRLTW